MFFGVLPSNDGQRPRPMNRRVTLLVQSLRQQMNRFLFVHRLVLPKIDPALDFNVGFHLYRKISCLVQIIQDALERSFAEIQSQTSSRTGLMQERLWVLTFQYLLCSVHNIFDVQILPFLRNGRGRPGPGLIHA